MSTRITRHRLAFGALLAICGVLALQYAGSAPEIAAPAELPMGVSPVDVASTRSTGDPTPARLQEPVEQLEDTIARLRAHGELPDPIFEWLKEVATDSGEDLDSIISHALPPGADGGPHRDVPDEAGTQDHEIEDGSDATPEL